MHSFKYSLYYDNELRITELYSNITLLSKLLFWPNKKNMVGSGYILNKIRVGRLFTFFENFFYLESSDLLGNEIR